MVRITVQELFPIATSLYPKARSSAEILFFSLSLWNGELCIPAFHLLLEL